MGRARIPSPICPMVVGAIEAMAFARTVSGLTSYPIRFLTQKSVLHEVIKRERAVCTAKCDCKFTQWPEQQTDGSNWDCDGADSICRSRHSMVAGSAGELSKSWRAAVAADWRRVSCIATFPVGRVYGCNWSWSNIFHASILLAKHGRGRWSPWKIGNTHFDFASLQILDGLKK